MLFVVLFNRFFFQELELRNDECDKLSQVRKQMENEVIELTASLFEVSKLNSLSLSSSLSLRSPTICGGCGHFSTLFFHISLE